ncbi:hypothetical protein FRB90_011620 [Tulasnella sp. 427]|nr:hypothetical protein FRB90_011620 [Tulasnella sp. 427]
MCMGQPSPQHPSPPASGEASHGAESMETLPESVQTGVKRVRGKLGKLESKRIIPSSLEFHPGGGSHSGGFAIVRKALLEGKDVAVKEMKVAANADVDRVLGLAIREADFLAELAHENIIQLEGLVEDTSKKTIWLVFPWAEHGNLFTFITSRDWEIPERLSLIYDVARGVEFLHDQSPPICHGDLKSLNILVNAGCHAIITDFGSARRIRQTDLSTVNGGAPVPLPDFTLEGEDAISAVQLTTTGDRVTLTAGKYTLRWAAPERLNEDPESLACDMWSLGWIAYEVMFGRVPFHDVKAEAVVIWRVMQGDLPCLTDDARMTLIRALCTLMMQCWSLDPDQRPKAVDCVAELSWMPMIVPIPTASASQQEADLREAEINMRLGRMYYEQCDYRNAKDCYTRAIETFTTNGRVERRATGVLALANVHRVRGEHGDAVGLFSEVLQIYTDVEDRTGMAPALWGLADVRRIQNRNDEAVKLYSEALQICTDIGDRGGRADALWGLADVHRRLNEYEEAVKLYSEALQIRTDIGDRSGRASALWGLAEVYRMRNQYEDAVQGYSEVLQIRTDIGDELGRLNALWGLADVYRMRNQYEEAVRLYSEVLRINTDIGNRGGRANALWGLAEAHRMQKDYDEAVKLYSETLQIRIDIGDQRGRAYTLLVLGDVHRSRDLHSDAAEKYSEALQIFTDIGDKNSISLVLERLAEIQPLRSDDLPSNPNS